MVGDLLSETVLIMTLVIKVSLVYAQAFFLLQGTEGIYDRLYSFISKVSITTRYNTINFYINSYLGIVLKISVVSPILPNLLYNYL